MDSLDYEIEEVFKKSDLFETLMEDLPHTNNKDNKDNKDNKTLLAQDIYMISSEFYNKIKTRIMRLQFKIVTSDMCRLFHEDNNIQRLLCTYHGPRTEWLDEDNIRREGLGLEIITK
jgi:hypothetical protein